METNQPTSFLPPEEDLSHASCSKLRDSIKTYGSNSYYYAHSRKIEIPADAIKVEGEGLVTGGNPVLLKVGAVNEQVKPVGKRLTFYSWADSGESVKIYIEDADWLRKAEVEAVETEFSTKSFILRASVGDDLTTFAIENLEEEIDPNGCFVRLSPGKRYTITLKKVKGTRTWYSLKKN